MKHLWVSASATISKNDGLYESFSTNAIMKPIKKRRLAEAAK